MSDSPRLTNAPRPPRPEPTKEIGSFLGSYELLYELATGGMGSVWVARDSANPEGRLVVIKRVKKQVVSRAGIGDRFAEAARRAAKVEHANVVATLDFLVHEGEPCIVTELLEAETLKSLVRLSATHRMPIPPSVVARIGLDLLAGLEAGHALESAGEALIHGDLSPENIFVTTSGLAKILDFGLAEPLVGTPASPLKNREKAGYQAPEQVKTGAAVDRRADIFSVGVLLWELFARERLFESKYEAAVAQKVLAAPIARLDALGKASTAVAEVVGRALQRDPSQRFATAADMAEALSRAAEGQLASADQVAIVVDNLAAAQLAQRKRAIEQALSKLPSRSTPLPSPTPKASSAAAFAPATPTPTPPPTSSRPSPPPPRPAMTPRPPAVVAQAAPSETPPPSTSTIEVDDILEEEEEGVDVPIDESPFDEPSRTPEPEPVAGRTPTPAPALASTPEPASMGPRPPAPAPASGEGEPATASPALAREPALTPELSPVPEPAPASTPEPAPQRDVVVSDSIVIAKEAFEPTPTSDPASTPRAADFDEDELAASGIPSRRMEPRNTRHIVVGVVGGAAALLVVAGVLSATGADKAKTTAREIAEPVPAAEPEPETIPAVVPPAPRPDPTPEPVAETVHEPASDPVPAEPTPAPKEPEVAAPAPSPAAAPTPTAAAPVPPPAPAAEPKPARAPAKAPPKPRKPAAPKAPAKKAFDPSSI